MMYQNKFVVAIKSGGKILREAKDLVALPFGSEFSVLVKNLNSRRAKFTLHIDGQDVLDGQEIIVDANNEVEMKRFIRNGNMNEGNAFKFIERTAAIEDGPRGIKMDDGVVRVEFWFEQEAPIVTTTYHHDVWWNEYYRPYYRRNIWSEPFGTGPVYGSITSTAGDLQNVKLGSTAVKTNSIMRGVVGAAAQSTNAVFSNESNASTISGSLGDSIASYSTDSIVPQADVTVTNDVGITVPGSKVEQKFHSVYGFKAESQSHVIVIRLAGRSGAINIVAPVTVKTKNICSTCSHTNKHNSKFCNQCGTGLEII
jgi:hypothetical protein